jgi:hypothetical protein
VGVAFASLARLAVGGSYRQTGDRHRLAPTFLTNHANQIVAADLFVVPTVTFRPLFVLVIFGRPSTNRPCGRHRPSNGGLDRPTVSERLP